MPRPPDDQEERERLAKIRRLDATRLQRPADDEPALTRRPAPGARALQALKAAQPDLTPAVDLQLELLAIERRVEARIPHPAPPPPEAEPPFLRFEEIPIDWSDFRVILREVADTLRRHDALDQPDYARAQELAHRAHDLRPLVAAWYAGPAELARTPSPPSDMLAQVLLLAMRPFLTRGAEACRVAVDRSGWIGGGCPVCGGEPDFATITVAAERRLICGRCTTQWKYHDFACPYCANVEKAAITTLASRDGQYRVYACDRCRRYLKVYDARGGPRGVLPAVDTIATLPLDAAALQRGYRA